MGTLSLKNRVNGASVSTLADIADLYTAVSLDDVDQDAEEQAAAPDPEDRYDNATNTEFTTITLPNGEKVSEDEYRRRTEAELRAKIEAERDAEIKEAMGNEQPGQDEKANTQADISEQVRKAVTKVTKPKRVEFRPIGSAPEGKDLTLITPERRQRISEEAGHLRRLFTKKTINGVSAGEKLAQAFTKIYPFLDSLNPGGEAAYWAFRNWAKSAQKDFIWGYRGITRGQNDRVWARRRQDSEALIAAQDRIQEGQGQLIYGMVKLYAINKMWKQIAHEQAEPIWDHNWEGLLMWMEVDYLKRRQEEGDRVREDIDETVENVLDEVSLEGLDEIAL